MNDNWVPEIFYEEADEAGLTSHIPFIAVPDEEEMPKILFIFESRETGEFEPGQDGEDLPVTQIDLHQYADMSALKASLDLETFDKVRKALGLQSLSEAAEAGKKITERIRTAVS
tara:strand:- start:869 stop:1213 length:345 start_codon:yes stop_codon:yes gene_type:complete